GCVRGSWGSWASRCRGGRLPVVLGVSLAVAVGAPCLVVTVVFALAGHGGLGHAGRLLLLLAAGGLVFLAGVYDDLHPGSTRGLAAHLRAMLAGRLTTGGVKLLAGVAAAAAAGLAV